MNEIETEGLLDLELLCSLAELEDDSGAAYLTDLYGLFERDARQTIESMRMFARDGDALALVRDAHRLKGASGLVGASRLARGFREIERDARSASAEILCARIGEAALTLDETVSALRDFVLSHTVGANSRPCA